MAHTMGDNLHASLRAGRFPFDVRASADPTSGVFLFPSTVDAAAATRVEASASRRNEVRSVALLASGGRPPAEALHAAPSLTQLAIRRLLGGGRADGRRVVTSPQRRLADARAALRSPSAAHARVPDGAARPAALRLVLDVVPTCATVEATMCTSEGHDDCVGHLRARAADAAGLPLHRVQLLVDGAPLDDDRAMLRDHDASHLAHGVVVQVCDRAGWPNTIFSQLEAQIERGRAERAAERSAAEDEIRRLTEAVGSLREAVGAAALARGGGAVAVAAGATPAAPATRRRTSRAAAWEARVHGVLGEW